MRRIWYAVLACSAVMGLLTVTGQSTPARAAANGTGGDFVAVPGTHLADTQTGLGGLGSSPVGAGETRSMTVLGAAGIPAAGVSAILVDVAVVAPTASTALKLWAGGDPVPGTTNINAVAGETISNAAVVPVSANGTIQVRNSFGTTHVVLDLEGYFTDTGSSGPTAGGFEALEPSRILDTRNGTGTGGTIAKIPANSSISVQAGGVAGVPTDAAAIFGNLAAVSPSSTGYLTAYATGTTRPSGTTVNHSTTTIASGASIPLGSGGQVTIYNGSSDPVDVLFDVQGYFSGNSSEGGGFTPKVTRLYASTGPIAPDATVDISVGGTNGLPLYGIEAAMVNLTVTGSTAGGYLRAWRTGWVEPTGVSINNFQTGNPRGSLAAVRPGEDGKITIRNVSGGSVNLYVDLQGTFAAKRVIAAEDEEAFVSSAMTYGATEAWARQAVYDQQLADGTAVEETTDAGGADDGTPIALEPDDEVLIAEDQTPGTTTKGFTDIHGVYQPDGEVTTYSSSCPSGTTSRWTYGNTWSIKNYVGITLLKVAYRKVWCTGGGKVTGVLSFSIIPSVTATGTSLGWDDYGVVSSASEDYYYTWNGHSRGGHHTTRAVRFKRCPWWIGGRCIENRVLSVTVNAHYNGSVAVGSAPSSVDSFGGGGQAA